MEKHFGFSLAEAGMVFYRRGLMVNARTLEVVKENDGEKLVGEFGYGLWMGTRKIVHNALYNAAIQSSDEGEPVKIIYEAAVVDYVSSLSLAPALRRKLASESCFNALNGAAGSQTWQHYSCRLHYAPRGYRHMFGRVTFAWDCACRRL